MRIVRAIVLRGALAVAVLAASAAPAHAGSFNVQCAFSHRLADDPIVFPGQPGASHLHDFYGARSATASSTYSAMLDSTSSCADRLDTAGYWHPTIRIAGRTRRGVATAYYSRGGKPTVRPYPADLRLIAGDARAVAPQPRSVVYWRCTGPKAAGTRSATVPRCRTGQRLTVNVRFPDCWDGLRLDSPDHKAHMAYSTRGACPMTHRRPVPELVLTIAWDARPAGGGQVRFSGGPAWTMHADLWNTWSQRRLKNLVNECLNLELDCGSVSSRPR